MNLQGDIANLMYDKVLECSIDHASEGLESADAKEDKTPDPALITCSICIGTQTPLRTVNPLWFKDSCKVCIVLVALWLMRIT